MNAGPLVINYLAVLVGAVVSIVIGALWYGPLFGKKWMQIIGVNDFDLDQTKKMRKSAGLLYIVQFVLTLFQVLVLSHLVADTARAGGVERSVWIWAAFVIPTLAGSVMWNNEKNGIKWSRFFIQGGYQLIMFFIYGLLLQFWK